MIYILFIWMAAGCISGGVCSTRPAYIGAYKTEVECRTAVLQDHIDDDGFCIEVPKKDLLK